MLKPYVCDCATAQNCPADDDSGEDSPQSALALSQQATSTAIERASAEATLEAESGEPSLRTLQREAAKDPLELIDPAVEEALVDASDAARADQIQQTFGIALDSEDGVAFTGNFSSQPGPELLLVRPGNSLAVYGADSRIGKLTLKGTLAPDSFAELGIAEEKTRPQAVRLVQDETLQVMLHWREKSEEGTFAYKVGVFKAIGPYIGRVFERTLGVSQTKDGVITRRGTYEVLRGDSHRFLRWIPAGESGELLTDQAELLQWNRWEGVYRVPKPPPTAPKNDSLRSSRATGPGMGNVARR